MKGNELTLLGEMPRVGDKMTDVTLIHNGLKPVKLSSFKGKVLVIVTVHSLDTSVCSIEAKRFNKEAKSMGDNVQVIIISADLPFAQERWRKEHDVEDIKFLSDYRDMAFGAAYGIQIKEQRLLARTVFVIDEKGTIRYTQLVEEVTDEPDYEWVLSALEDIQSAKV